MLPGVLLGLERHAMDMGLRVVRGAASGCFLGTVIGLSEAAILHFGSQGPALHVFAPAVVIDGLAGLLLGALVGVVARVPGPGPGASAGAGVFAAGLGLLLGLGPWARPAPAQQPPLSLPDLRPLLIVAVDGLAPGDLERMPRLTGAAEQAVVFVDVWGWSTQPRAVMASLLTARLGPGHGADDGPLGDDVPTLGRALERDGRPTAAFVQRDADLAAGFREVELVQARNAFGQRPPVRSLLLWPLVQAVWGPEGRPGAYAVAGDVVARAEAFVHGHADRPWSVFVQLSDPVWEGGDRAEGLALADAAIGGLLDTARAASPDVVWSVVGTVGAVEPGVELPASTMLQVPWVVGGSSLPPMRVPDVVAAIDVVPSLLAESGSGYLGVWDGHELFRSLGSSRHKVPAGIEEREKDLPCHFAYGEPERRPVLGVDPTTGRVLVRNDGYVVHLREGKTWALFDRVIDPGETHELLGAGEMTCDDMTAADRAADIAERGLEILNGSASGAGRTLPPPPSKRPPGLVPPPL